MWGVGLLKLYETVNVNRGSDVSWDGAWAALDDDHNHSSGAMPELWRRHTSVFAGSDPWSEFRVANIFWLYIEETFAPLSCMLWDYTYPYGASRAEKGTTNHSSVQLIGIRTSKMAH